jgi:hypothetical protein
MALQPGNAAISRFSGTVLGFVTIRIQRIGPVRAGIFINFVPVSAVLLALSSRDEPDHDLLLAGVHPVPRLFREVYSHHPGVSPC